MIIYIYMCVCVCVYIVSPAPAAVVCREERNAAATVCCY